MKLTISRIDQIAEDVRAFELRDPGGAALHFFISASQWESRHARETIPVSACGEGSHDRSRNATLPERMKAAICHRTGRPRAAGFVARSVIRIILAASNALWCTEECHAPENQRVLVTGYGCGILPAIGGALHKEDAHIYCRTRRGKAKDHQIQIAFLDGARKIGYYAVDPIFQCALDSAPARIAASLEAGSSWRPAA